MFRPALISILFSLTAFPALGALDPRCPKALKRTHAILARFDQDAGYARFTPEKAKALQDKIETHLRELGVHLENYDVDAFARERLEEIAAVRELSAPARARLTEALRPSFESRALPSLAALRSALRDARLSSLPAGKIRDAMDLSFRKWRTKLVFDEIGPARWNQLAKGFVEKMRIGELSMEIGLLLKNNWEAFFESEKGAGIFNPSLPGILGDRFTAVDGHEVVHMVVQSMAAEGKESPYHLWIKMEKRFRKSGAIGGSQKENLLKAADALDDGDFYRTELYADEIPAHILELSLLSVQLSKALRESFTRFADGAAGRRALREELDDVYAAFLRAEDGQPDWEAFSPKARELFESFLSRNASDGRTRVAKLVGEMTDLMNSIDLVQDPVATAVHEARKIIEEEARVAARSGKKEIRPRRGGPITIRKDEFLGEPGYLVDVRIPIDVLVDGEFKRVERGASVRFRFTNQGDATATITPEKFEKLVSQAGWTARLAKAVDRDIDEYVELFGSGTPESYTIAQVFGLKRVQTKMRKTVRQATEEIRDER